MNYLERVMNKIMKPKPLDNDHKMMLKSRDLGDGKYEVGGVVFFADTHAEAIRKYRRASRGDN
jgi:hypothetical protein